MKNKLLPIFLALSVISLGGCADGLNPNANLISIVPSNTNLTHCQFKGEVIGSQGNWLTGAWTENENLLIGAMNDMKNQAYKVGANTIIQTVKSTISSNDVNYGDDNNTVIGQGYYCTPKELEAGLSHKITAAIKTN